MAHARLPDDKIQQIIRLRNAGRSTREIGRELGIAQQTVSKYILSYGRKPAASVSHDPPRREQVVDRSDIDGTVEVIKMDRPASVEEMMALCRLDPTRWIAQHYTGNAWQGFAKMRVGDKDEIRKVPVYQSKISCKRILAEEVETAILEFVQKHVGAIPPLPRRIGDEPAPFMVCWGLWDTHIGMYAWNTEVGASFDVNIARARVLNSIDDMAAELAPYRVERVIMPVGNDFMHFDSVRHTTALGQHFLDTDTRYAKVYLIALECLSYMVEKALGLADRVDILYVPGNHDTTSSFTLCAALAQRYREESRVSVDLRANPRKYVTHGSVLLGFDHGGDARAQQLSLIFATEAKEHWTASTYREVQVGHTHQRRERSWEGVVPTNGVLVRTNPALCNNDLWHHKQGLIGEPVKSVEAWRYDRVGYRGSHVTWARDDARTK